MLLYFVVAFDYGTTIVSPVVVSINQSVCICMYVCVCFFLNLVLPIHNTVFKGTGDRMQKGKDIKKKKGGEGFELDKNENSGRNAEVKRKREKKNSSSVCQPPKPQK